MTLLTTLLPCGHRSTAVRPTTTSLAGASRALRAAAARQAAARRAAVRRDAVRPAPGGRRPGHPMTGQPRPSRLSRGAAAAPPTMAGMRPLTAAAARGGRDFVTAPALARQLTGAAVIPAARRSSSSGTGSACRARLARLARGRRRARPVGQPSARPAEAAASGEGPVTTPTAMLRRAAGRCSGTGASTGRAPAGRREQTRGGPDRAGWAAAPAAAGAAGAAAIGARASATGCCTAAGGGTGPGRKPSWWRSARRRHSLCSCWPP